MIEFIAHLFFQSFQNLFVLCSVTAEKWVPIIEVPVDSIKVYLQKKKREGFCILGLEQTANSVPLDKYIFPKKMVSIQPSSSLTIFFMIGDISSGVYILLFGLIFYVVSCCCSGRQG